MPEPISSYTYSAGLRQQLASNLDAFVDQRQPSTGLVSAAVALTVFEDNTTGLAEAALIVTKRTPRLKNHGGQWALPGGRVDPGESIEQAALRELQEEVNLDLSPDAILGTLDDYVTRSGFIITPVLVWSDTSLDELVANPDEVASIHAFSFTELVREDSPNLEDIAESDRQVLSMNYLDDRIYSPTAAMLYQFREVCLLNNETRVLHYDQPVFAWK